MSVAVDKLKVPKLRFPEFKGEWVRSQLGDLATFSKGKNVAKDDIVEGGATPCIRYGELYTRYSEVIREVYSRTNLPHSELVFSEAGDVIIPASGEAAMDIATASYVESKGIALGGDLNIIRSNISGHFLAYILSHRQKKCIARLAQGNSVVHLYKDQLASLEIALPNWAEQRRISDSIDVVDGKARLLGQQREALTAYKKGMMQRLFSQELRFVRDDGSTFPDWQEKRLAEVLIERKERSTGAERVHSVSVHKGVIDQIEHLGRSFAAAATDHYGLVKPGDVIYTKSPTGDFPFGIIKQSRLSENVIVSPLYGVFTPETYALGYILNEHFCSVINTHNYLHRLVQKGAKNTINITNDGFLEGRLKLPVDHDEQQKIANFLAALDAKIDAVTSQIDAMQRFKKGLLQQMFV